jgi:hypothetical protein
MIDVALFCPSERITEADRMNARSTRFGKQRGQGLVEYALIMVLVVLVFWVTIKETNIGPAIANQWSKIIVCIGAPFSCSAS